MDSIWVDRFPDRSLPGCLLRGRTVCCTIGKSPRHADSFANSHAAVQALLDEAYEALYTNGNSQFVVDTLGPHLEEFSNPDDLSKALEYLAMAEIGLGHYQISAAYLERLCQISPTPENYGMLARVYDSGGDLEHALANYLIYLESVDPNLTEDVRQMVQDRVDQIQAILTSFTPTPGTYSLL